jgi:hypothetical protein
MRRGMSWSPPSLSTTDGPNCCRDSVRRLRASRRPAASAPNIDGSFVTDKDLPEDFYGCWETAGVDPTLLDPELLDFREARAAQKAKYGGELFPANGPTDPAGRAFLDFFQVDRERRRKGIVAIDPGAL